MANDCMYITIFCAGSDIIIISSRALLVKACKS